MSQDNRRQFLRRVGGQALGTLAAGSLGYAGSGTNPGSRPNIIFILADDLGYGDLGCYGQKHIQTPHLDRLAGEGIRFTQHYSGSPVCAPSRCTLLTGKHTGHASRRNNRPYIPLQPEDVTVAEVLKQQGYATGGVGKWGLADTEGDFDAGTTGKPGQRGFDYWFGFLNQKHAWDYYPEFVWENDEKFYLNQERYVQDVFTEKSLEFIRQNRNHPFFLYAAFTVPHVNNALGHTPYSIPVPSDEPYSDREWPQVEKNYAAMITRMDAQVGRILDLLDELELSDQTLIVFSSDNGAQNFAPHQAEFFDSTGGLRGYKQYVYEGGIRVPLVARWPEIVSPGSVSHHVSAFWDFLPTAAEISGSEVPQAIDGISFLPTLKRESQQPHQDLYWEFPALGYQQALRINDWKAVRVGGRDGPVQLYDLSQDPGEQNDLASQNPALVSRIRKRMESARTPSVHWPLP